MPIDDRVLRPADSRTKRGGTLTDAQEEAQRGDITALRQAAETPWVPFQTRTDRDPTKTPRVPVKKLKSDLAKVKKEIGKRGKQTRQDSTYPYLLIRTMAGDTGIRPVQTNAWWASPDIMLMPDGPGPFDRNKLVAGPTSGASYRVFVHCWNLGRADIYGAKLRVYWVDPGFFGDKMPDPNYPLHYIGGAYVDLARREHAGCHSIAEISSTWTPTGSGHECLIVVLDSPLDRAGASWDCRQDRHVAQRNVTVLKGTADLAGLLDELAQKVSKDDRVAVVHDNSGLGNFLAAHPGLSRARRLTQTSARTLGQLSAGDLTSQAHSMFGTPDLQAATVRRALVGRSTAPQMLQLQLTSGDTVVGGYSVVLV